MKRILVSGLINLETTLRVDRFPVTYEPVRFPFWGVQSTVSGVGYNLAKALTVLGNELSFMSMIGQGNVGKMVLQALQDDRIPRDFVITQLSQTPQSVILYDQVGQRQIHVDLKDIQERPFPPDLFQQALSDCNLALLCNINFNRPFLQQAKRAGDALFSSFNHFYHKTDDPYQAIQKAIYFASYKIGEAGAAHGFLSESALEELMM